MQVPGIGSARIPSRVRLFFALSLTAMVTPTISSADLLADLAGPNLLAAICSELFVGFAVGVSARIYLGAMEFAGTMVANMIGLNTLVPGIEHEEQAAIVSALVSATVTLVLLLGDLYGQIVSSLLNSYSMLPIRAATDVASGLRLFASTLSAAFLLGLQVTGPFIVYGILANLLFGVLGKLGTADPLLFRVGSIHGDGWNCALVFAVSRDAAGLHESDRRENIATVGQVMKSIAIKRLKRLLDLAGHIYDLRSREAAQAHENQTAIAQSLNVARASSGSHSLTETVFPGLSARRVARLGRELDIADAKLDSHRDAAASAKSSVKGLEGKLQRVVTMQEQTRAAAELEEAISSYLRSASLR